MAQALHTENVLNIITKVNAPYHIVATFIDVYNAKIPTLPSIVEYTTLHKICHKTRTRPRDRDQTEMFVPSKGQVSNIIIEGEGMQVDSYHIGDLMKLGKTLMKIDVLTSML
jgi:hypothetical protein